MIHTRGYSMYKHNIASVTTVINKFRHCELIHLTMKTVIAQYKCASLTDLVQQSDSLKLVGSTHLLLFPVEDVQI